MASVWNIEDLDLLASDLDTSLSGLGGATTTTFDMSDAVSAIQVIKMNREQTNTNRKSSKEPTFSGSLEKDNFIDKAKPQPQQDLNLCYVPLSGKVIKKPCRNREDEIQHGKNNFNGELSFHMLADEFRGSSSIVSAPTLSGSLSKRSLQPGFTMKDPLATQCEFQYVLAAATALGTRVGEDTLTYLNQGQSYEIRLKKMNGISEMRGKLLKSVLRVGFQERRLQYREKSEIYAWQNQRPSERILDIDLSLSYGIFDVIPDSKNINSCEFMWDPTREASVFLRINCISTEFTCKRRGGEKGVPFRILIETYSHWEDPPQKLDAASCLVKVFKSKGADRKHKTDREKIEKMPQAEQRDLQPSYQCTVFTACSIKVEDIPFRDSSENFSPQNFSLDIKPDSPVLSTTEVTTSTPSVSSSPLHEVKDRLEDEEALIFSPLHSLESYLTVLSSDSEVHSWLVKKKFIKYLSCFSLFSAKDLLCLSREDLIEICGVGDGIRLHNCLHKRHVRPQLTIYVSTDKCAFQAVYLDCLTAREIKEEIGKICGFQHHNLGSVYLTGPEGILVYLTDKVVQNMKNESAFTCEILKAEEHETFSAILRSYR